MLSKCFGTDRISQDFNTVENDEKLWPSDVGTIFSPTHFLHFYQHGHELLEVSAEFRHAGLKEDDCCVWLTGAPWTVPLAVHQLTLHYPRQLRAS